MIFDDREHAGELLANKLKEYPEFLENSILFTIPRGGIVIAYKIAISLKIPISLIITKKLGSPNNPEFGFGAIAPDGTYLLNKRAYAYLGIPQDIFDKIKEDALKEVKRRIKEYNQRKFYNIQGKKAIVVDDGIATGYTAMVAGKYLRKKSVSQTVLAIPVGSISSFELAKNYFDEVICLQTDNSGYFAVGKYYKDFHQVPDEEMLSYMDKAKKQHLLFGFDEISSVI